MSDLKDNTYSTDGKNRPFTPTIGVFIAFAVMITSVTVFGEWIRRASSRIDLGNLLDNRSVDILLFSAIAFIPFVLLLCFQFLVRKLSRGEIPVIYKGIALIVATILVYIGGSLLLPAAAQSTLAWLVGGGMLTALLFDIFTEEKETTFSWTILALLTVNFLSATGLWLYYKAQNANIRQGYANALSMSRDTAYSEPELAKFEQALQNDQRLPFLLKAWPIKPSSDSIRTYLSKLSFEQKYLFKYYNIKAFAFDRTETTPLLLDQVEDRLEINAIWEKATVIPGLTNVKQDYAGSGAHRYLVRAVINRMSDPNHPVEIFCFFEENYPQNTQIYSQIYTDKAFKNLALLPRFNYAVTRERQLVVEQGTISPKSLGMSLSPNSTAEITDGGQVEQMTASEDGKTVAIVGQPEIGLLRLMYLFSTLFTLSTSLLIVVGFFSGFLPKTTLLPSFRGSLGRRIQYAIIGVLGIGFIALGYFAYRHFSASALEKSEKISLERAQAVAAHLRQVSGRLQPDSAQQVLGVRLIQFAQSLNIDANLYNTKGQMVASTRDDLRRIGVLEQQISTPVITELNDGLSSVDTEEKIDNQTFTTKYLPIRNAGQSVIAYIGLPYRNDLSKTKQEISDFIGILASIYAFLLLLAAGVTRVVSNTITRPLKNVSDKIKEVQLVDKNEMLTYDGDASDEISGLVDEYNRMVDKLEDSKLQLVKLERESAWRDMARQIAHDIKNPLTTMKLSMQQLERVSNDPNQAAAYLKRATGRLIEQIDSLAQTASEFSMFASLDRTPRFPVNINHLVESVFDLFTEQKDVDLSLELPDETYMVLADKNHLLRVLNNLVINAIQAIPSDRRGKVNVTLLKEKNNAVIRISDNGGGIPGEIRERVFEPNFTTKTSGSGLGLAICKKIVEAHSGDIRFETIDNEGTKFFLELPLAKTEE